VSIDNEDEERQLRAAALKNVESILVARKHAEQELLAAKQALELRTRELEQQREWFQVTLSSIGDAVITTDVEGRITFLNPVAEAMTGWPNAEAQGKPLTDVFHIINERTRQIAHNPIERVIQTGSVVELANHTSLIARDGAEVPIEDSAAPIRDPQGNIAGCVMVFHDVTRRRTAERALRLNEEQLRAIFAQAAIGIALTDLSGRFIEANPRFRNILGYSLEELRERSLMDLGLAEDRVTMQQNMQRLFTEAAPSYVTQNRYVRKDGRIAWSNTTVSVLRDENGEAQRLISTIEDITGLRQADEVRAHLAAIIESTDDAVITKTLEGIITSWNRSAERTFGYTAAEMVGKSITLLMPPDHVNEEPAILERLKRGERIEHYETIRVTKQGVLLNVSLSVSPLKDSQGRIIGASKIARDITRQKRSEEALREADRRKDEFIATLAHELRNPLAPIRQAAMISVAATASEAQKRWSHDVINRQVHHMSLLLDDLLDVSRVTRGTLELRLEMIDLAAVVDAALETARPILDSKRHRLTVELPAHRVSFAADPLRLAQVLSNLLTNAAKYTDHEGQISLRTIESGELVTITVSDTGIGIPPESISRIFEMFSQIKSSQDRSEGGLGIGLALTKGLIQMHGGVIEARSDGLGRGSEFTVRLPRRVLSGSKDRQPVLGAVEVSCSRRRVLIADDNRDAADSLAALLRMQGHEVSIVHNGAEALARFNTLMPEVVLLDIGMPELDGYEVARQVRELAGVRAVRLIAVTGWGQEGDRARAIQAGFDHHFTKPVDPTRLMELVARET
jgi:PAS domain S-box-containing protein